LLALPAKCRVVEAALDGEAAQPRSEGEGGGGSRDRDSDAIGQMLRGEQCGLFRSCTSVQARQLQHEPCEAWKLRSGGHSANATCMLLSIHVF